MDPPGDAQLQPRLRTAVEDAPFSHFRTRSFYMRKSLSVDNHLGSLGYAVHPAETKAERVRTKLRRQFVSTRRAASLTRAEWVRRNTDVSRSWFYVKHYRNSKEVSPAWWSR